VKKKKWVFVYAFVVAKNCGSFLLPLLLRKKNEGFGYCPMLERKNVGLE
jgi:hypothetical protein